MSYHTQVEGAMVTTTRGRVVRGGGNLQPVMPAALPRAPVLGEA